MGLNPGSGRSPEGGHGNLLQYSCWRIPWTEEPGRLQSIGSQRVSLIHTHTHTHTHTHIYQGMFYESDYSIINLKRDKIPKHSLLFLNCPLQNFFSCGFPKPWLFISSRIKSWSLGLISKTLNSVTSASYFNSASHFISPHPWRLMSPLISKAFIIYTFHLTLSIAMSCFIVVYLVHMSGLSHTLLVGHPLKASIMSYLFVLTLLKIMT